MLVCKKCFKAKNNLQANFRSFKFMDINITSSLIQSLRLAVIYRAPPSPENGFTVKMFFDEFSSFLEGLVFTPGALLVTGDSNFHMDEPDDHDACRFLQVLQSFDLTQDVSKSTHRKGHIHDLMITRADDDIIRECTVEDLFISDHLAVHSSLRLAKLPLERKKILYRKILTMTNFVTISRTLV